MEGIRESVLGGQESKCCKPGVGDAVVKYMDRVLEENAAVSEFGNHVQKGKLVFMQEGGGW